MIVRTALAAALLFAGVLVFTPEAEAGRRFWRARSSRAATHTPANAYRWTRYSPGVARGEYEVYRQREAWYNRAYNGFSPFDFR